jgi:hypothetical protein
MNIIDEDKWINTISNMVNEHNLPSECTGGILLDVGANIGAFSKLFKNKNILNFIKS